MSLRRLFQAWNSFFFKPQSPLPVCLFRILYGLVVLADLIMLRREWLMWYGPHAFTSFSTVHKLDANVHMNLLELLPQTNLAVNIFYWVFLVCTLFLIVGYMTKFSAVAVYLCMGSIQLRNGYILNSGDTLILVCGFFLMFAPIGSALSVDRWLKIRRGKISGAVPLYSPWAQRMLQIQIAVVYFATFYWKSLGVTWMNGTAVYYALHIQDMQRFPFPDFHHLFIYQALTWSTLLIEFALGVLVWFKELRYPVLLAGVCLHLGIEYAMNIPLFELMAMATYVNFIEPEDLTRMWNWTRNQMGRHFKHTAPSLPVETRGPGIPAMMAVQDDHV